MWFILFSFGCFIFSTMLFIIFKSKQHIDSMENKLFLRVNLITVLGSLSEIILELIVKAQANMVIQIFFAKLFLLFVSLWFTLLSMYVFYILQFKKNKYFDIVNKIHYVLFALFSILYYCLPIEIFYENNVMYSYGVCVNLLKVLIGIYIGTWIVLSAIKHKLTLRKVYLPIFFVYIMLIANLILQSIDPSLTLVSFTLTFTIYLMYFTIENPDIKLVNELYKNKSIMEQSYVDKSNFMFEMTQEIRDPLNNIKNEYRSLKGSKNIKDYEKFVEKIGTYSRQLEFIINDVLNVNTLDVQQIKFIENKYNFDLVFNQVVGQVKESINPKVKFDYQCTSDIPALYGDSIKIKQLMSALLQNSIHHTQSGFISLNVDTIERYDALRLIIQIKDTSGGIPIDIVNDILNTTASLDQKDIELLERNTLSMTLCQKVVKLMGGNLMIKNTNKKGTEMILIIDQRIDASDKSLGTYEKYIATEKKAAVVSQNKKLNDYVRKFFNTNEVKNTIILNGNYLLDDIKSGKHFDYILVSNDMKEINGYTILKKLKEIPDFNTPVIMLLENASLKEEFLKEGFSEVIVIDQLEEGLEELVKKY